MAGRYSHFRLTAGDPVDRRLFGKLVSQPSLPTTGCPIAVRPFDKSDGLGQSRISLPIFDFKPLATFSPCRATPSFASCPATLVHGLRTNKFDHDPFQWPLPPPSGPPHLAVAQKLAQGFMH